ncbi:hypothetical protein [Brevundimonas sp.]|uniref:hypothetical protein n=1 Tax=Brevundimonas sp. TaxID=1871086 RepID=UPI003D150026
MRTVFSACVAALALCACGQPAAAPVEPATASGDAAPAGDFQTNVALVQALYAEDAIPTDPAGVRKYFTEEFVPAMTGPDGFPFDYRVSNQDGVHDSLTIAETDGDGGNGRVVARYAWMGSPGETAFTICRQPDGALRIVNVLTTMGDGQISDLRQVAELPARPEGC